MSFDKKGYEVLTDEMLNEIVGGGGWSSAIEGLLGGLGVNPSQTAEQVVNQLNGVSNFSSHSCSPGGTGGTPNAC